MAGYGLPSPDIATKCMDALDYKDIRGVSVISISAVCLTLSLRLAMGTQNVSFSGIIFRSSLDGPLPSLLCPPSLYYNIIIWQPAAEPNLERLRKSSEHNYSLHL